MFWVKKATAASLAATMLVVVGLGVGVSVRQMPSAVAGGGQPVKPTTKVEANSPHGELDRLRQELDALQRQIELNDAEYRRLHLNADALAIQAKTVRDQREEIAAKYAALKAKQESLAKAAKNPVNPPASYLALTVGGEKSVFRFSVTEFEAPGKPLWSVAPRVDLAAKPQPLSPRSAGEVEKELAESVKPIGQYLARAKNDPAAPTTLRFVIVTGATLQDVLAAAEACKAAGYTQIRLSGCIPPGCGIGAGKSPDGSDTRYGDAAFELDRLLEMLKANLLKC